MRILLYVSTTALALLVHLLCCLLPVLAIVLGAGSYFGPVAWVAQHRLWVLGTQAVLLGWGFWRAYRSKGAAHAWERGVLWGGVVLTLAAATLPHAGAFQSEEAQLGHRQLERLMMTRRVVFQVEGTLPNKVRLDEDLAAVEGVLLNQIRVTGYAVSVRYQWQRVSKARLFDELTRRGYRLCELPADSIFLTAHP
jgi:hypothetical protein